MIAWPCAVALALTLQTGTPVSVGGGVDPVPDLPICLPDSVWQPLSETVDPAMQARLEAELRSRPQWRKLIDRKKMCVGLVDLSDPAKPRFARINGSTELYAASLPKIAILMSAHQAMEDGSLIPTPEILQDMEDMIRVSSNPAATRVIELVGLEAIEATVTDPRYMLYDPSHGGGLWVGKKYGKSDQRRGDPIHDISHAATVTQICRFYYLLATGRVISPERSAAMLASLSDPGLHHKFVKALDQRAPWAQLFRKSGTFRTHHADSALVWGEKWRRYILTALIDSKDGEKILQDLVPAAEKVLQHRD